MLDALGPAHFADVDEAFDSFIELHKSAVIGDGHDFSTEVRPSGKPFGNSGPRIRNKLFAAEGNAHLLAVKFEDVHLNFVALLDGFRRMSDSSPDEIADVKEAVDAAKVHENAIISDVFHFAIDDGAFGERIGKRLALLFLLFFENGAAADDDVAAFAIEFEHANFNFAILPRFQIVRGAQIKLRSREKRAKANVHNQAAFDAVGDRAFQSRAVLVGIFNALPDGAAMSSRVREEDVAFFLLVQALDFNQIARLEMNPAGVDKFLRGDQAFKFSANVHHEAQIIDGDDAAFENFAAAGGGLRSGILLDELLHGGRGVFVGIFRSCQRFRPVLSCFGGLRGVFGERIFRFGAVLLGPL